MAELINNVTKKHTIHIEYGENIKVTGVINILSYDDQNVEIKLSDNIVFLKGEAFDIKLLDLEKSEVIISGRIASLNYAKTREKVGFIKRILK